jgi:hypothetical protein
LNRVRTVNITEEATELRAVSDNDHVVMPEPLPIVKGSRAWWVYLICVLLWPFTPCILRWFPCDRMPTEEEQERHKARMLMEQLVFKPHLSHQLVPLIQMAERRALEARICALEGKLSLASREREVNTAVMSVMADRLTRR